MHRLIFFLPVPSVDLLSSIIISLFPGEYLHICEDTGWGSTYWEENSLGHSGRRLSIRGLSALQDGEVFP